MWTFIFSILIGVITLINIHSSKFYIVKEHSFIVGVWGGAVRIVETLYQGDQMGQINNLNWTWN